MRVIASRFRHGQRKPLFLPACYQDSFKHTNCFRSLGYLEKGNSRQVEKNKLSIVKATPSSNQRLNCTITPQHSQSINQRLNCTIKPHHSQSSNQSTANMLEPGRLFQSDIPTCFLRLSVLIACSRRSRNASKSSSLCAIWSRRWISLSNWASTTFPAWRSCCSMTRSIATMFRFFLPRLDNGRKPEAQRL